MASLSQISSCELPNNPTRTDLKSHCIPFILRHYYLKQSLLDDDGLFIIGLNGVQGVGKTTLVSSLANILYEYHGLETLVLSIDDMYLKHEDQVALAEEHKDNPLVQHRGQPGTHDIPLLYRVFGALLSRRNVKIPAYNKSAFSGQGDRLPTSLWRTVNDLSQRPIQIVILEGWCVGFRSLDSTAVVSLASSEKTKTLHKHRLTDLLFVNEKLKDYEEIWDLFDAFVNVDAEDLEWVYEWREEAEEMARREKGEQFGMTKEQVRAFVDGYFPGYKMFTRGVREGVFLGGRKGRSRDVMNGRQLRLIVGRDRQLKTALTI